MPTAPRSEVAETIWDIVLKRLDPATAPVDARGRGLVSAPAADADDEVGLAAPRQTTVLFGHAEAEQTLLDAYRSGRMPHAWLIGGPPGIGKATLAYRMARFVLAHPDPTAPAVQSAQLARARSRSSGGAPHRRAGAPRPAGARAHRRRKRQAAHAHRRSTRFAGR